MTEQLPISIIVGNELLPKFAKITSVTNKLVAQFNFQTMAANWYSDENNIWYVQIHLETPHSFIAHQAKSQASYLIKNYSDDAFSYIDNNSEQILTCFIAITDVELTLLNQQHTLLAGLLNIKLQKVLNLIAKQLKLAAI